MKQATLKDAPAALNTNDRAMWVLGFNEALDRCRAACEAQRLDHYRPDGDVFDAGVEACIDALGVDAPRKITSLAEFCAEAKRTGLTAAALAEALSKRPEFADCLPGADGGAPCDDTEQPSAAVTIGTAAFDRIADGFIKSVQVRHTMRDEFIEALEVEAEEYGRTRGVEGRERSPDEPLPPEVLVDAHTDRAHTPEQIKPCTRGVALPAATFREGNWSHPDGDGSRIVGWRIPAADVQRMGVDAYRLPGEVVDALAKLAAHGVPGTFNDQQEQP